MSNGFTQGKYQQNALRTNYPSLYVQGLPRPPGSL